jgi:hypothetical protein
MKGGTTALYHYLRLHPAVAMPRRKELAFFVDGRLDSAAAREPVGGSWHRGVDWYRQWFQTDKPVCGEASPHYTFGPHAAIAAARMDATVPGVRLIYLVRNPLDRMRSHYQMAIRWPGATRRSFAEFIASSHALATSSYGTILREYLRHFPRDRILVVESAELDLRRREALPTIFRFLGIDDRFWSRHYDRRIFVGSRRPLVSPLGGHIRDSRLMGSLRRHLTPAAFYHVERMLLHPFGVAEPPLDLPPAQAADVVDRLTAEMRSLREATGLALPSLDVTLDQAVSTRPVYDG